MVISYSFTLGLIFCVSYVPYMVFVKIKFCVSLCICVCIAWKGHSRSDLYCVGRDGKPYALTHLIWKGVCDFLWVPAPYPMVASPSL